MQIPQKCSVLSPNCSNCCKGHRKQGIPFFWFDALNIYFWIPPPSNYGHLWLWRWGFDAYGTVMRSAKGLTGWSQTLGTGNLPQLVFRESTWVLVENKYPVVQWWIFLIFKKRPFFSCSIPAIQRSHHPCRASGSSSWGPLRGRITRVRNMVKVWKVGSKSWNTVYRKESWLVQWIPAAPIKL